MADNTVSGLVMFIAALLVAGLAAAVMANVVGNFAIELRERGGGLTEALGTDLALVNDPDNMPYSGGELTLYVKNTGTTTLVAEELTVLVNGQHESFTSALLDGATSWTTGTVIELTVTVTLASGDHTARVVHTPNIVDTMEFRI